MFVTAYAGPALWHTPLALPGGIQSTWGWSYASLGIVGAVIGAWSSFKKVLHCVAQRQTTLAEALWRLIPGTTCAARMRLSSRD